MYLLLNKMRVKDIKNNKELKFEKIVKHNNNIYCYDNDSVILSLEGISNIQEYEVEDGEFSYPSKTKEEIQQEINAKLLKNNATLQIELEKQKKINATLLIQVAQLGGNK